MAEVVVFGLGESAEVATHYLEHDSEHTVVGYTIDGAYLDRDRHRGRPVVAFEEIESRFSPEACHVALALGYWRANAVRAERFAAARARGYRVLSFVSSRAIVPAGFQAPEGTFIHPGCTIEPFVELGVNVTVWSGTTVSHHSVIGDHAFLASQVAVAGGVRIGERAFIGAGAAIRDHVSIGKRAVLGAGAVILQDVGDDEVWVAPRAQRLSRSSASVLIPARGA